MKLPHLCSALILRPGLILIHRDEKSHPFLKPGLYAQTLDKSQNKLFSRHFRYAEYNFSSNGAQEYETQTLSACHIIRTFFST